MNADAPEPPVQPQDQSPAPFQHKPLPPAAPTPMTWRLIIEAAILVLATGAYLLRGLIGLRGQALCGVFVFFALVAVFSVNLRAVNWRTIAWGVGLQVALALMVLKVPFVRQGFDHVGDGVKSFIGF